MEDPGVDNIKEEERSEEVWSMSIFKHRHHHNETNWKGGELR
jgi:hypothetical protein